MRNRPIPKLQDADQAYIRKLLIHEDPEYLVFNKPSGFPVQTRGNRGRNLDHLLWAFARSNGKRPRLVHRIDTGTSGLVIAAKTHPVAVYLSSQFAERRVKKTYLAVVRCAKGCDENGTIDAPLKSREKRPPKTEVNEQGRPATTHWRQLDQADTYALLEVRPITGRMHQIRAHLAHIGMPLLGDNLYGGPVAPRLMLHALRLSFTDTQGVSREHEASPGEDFKSLCAHYGLTYFAP
jgi:RluA family pseudouridine synthase